MGARVTRALLVGVCIRTPDFWKLTCGKVIAKLQMLGREPQAAREVNRRLRGDMSR